MSLPDDPNSSSTTPAASETPDGVRLSRRYVWAIGIVIVIVAVGIGALVSQLADKKSPAPGQAAKPTVSVRAVSSVPAPTATFDPTIKVYVAGEVKNPGVYEMQWGERVVDAVQRAGGFTEGADRGRVEQAKRVFDEMRIDIPRLPATPTPVPPLPTVGPGTVAAAAPPPPTAAPPLVGNGKLNVNTASVAELDKLPGIGEVLSQRIIEARKNGPFKDVDDLRTRVTGLSRSTLDKIKDLIIF